MEHEEKMMTGEESIRIITEMLNKTRVNIRQGIFHLLLWGWMIALCSLGEYILIRFTGITKPWLIWMLVIPGMFVSMIYGMVNGRRAKIHTYADKVWMWTWFAYLFAMFVLFTIHSRNMESISAYMLMITGIPTFMSGIIIRFRPLIIGGICFWVLSLFVSFAGPVIGPLGVPFAMIVGYLIPGYMLKNKIDHGTV
ncbi:MAG: hypothetical protein IPN67_03080 [Bacteroidales bacterium]|nr:hypothetical protein [Bacteroidales bacterium]MBK8881379.1 hypothetical protein [Bacteroidales bacterium]